MRTACLLQATVGVDFLSKTVYLDNGAAPRLQLWDTAGQDRFASLLPTYVRDAHAVVLVYDVTARATFAQLDRWVDLVRRTTEESTLRPTLFLVGNKSDAAAEARQISASEGASLAAEIGATFVETSAKTGAQAKLVFRLIALQAAPSPLDVPIITSQPTTEAAQVAAGRQGAETQKPARFACDLAVGPCWGHAKGLAAYIGRLFSAL